jgi:hypothetical protein
VNADKNIYRLVLLLIFAILAVHIWQYVFLVDDAFISFRYAKNLASGEGLVFNKGERVEGYTDFLWVVILSLFSLLGFQPEVAANVIGIIMAAALTAMVAFYSNRHFSEGRYDLLTLIAPLLLALNRTYAVWSTGGLETKLFSLLVFLSAAFLIHTDSRAIRKMMLSSLFFALASLSRPEGILLFLSFFGYKIAAAREDKNRIKLILKSSLPYFAVVGAHFAFRLLYYGYPLPNTYYAKVTGAWVDAGGLYLLQFFHEYGLYFLLIPALFVFSKNYYSDKRKTLLHLTIPFAPYLLYIVYIGGDHFEYRFLDVTLPFAALLIQEGFRAFLKFLRPRLPAAAKAVVSIYLAAALFLYCLPGWLSHRNFPTTYHSATAITSADPDKSLFARLPILHRYLRFLDDIHARLAEHFIGIRQEEHRLALEQVFLPQAALINDAVRKGLIDRHDIISLWCVGAIPYYTNLTTIDYLGLTDSYVAHRPFPKLAEKLLGITKLMAHRKRADRDYLIRRGVKYMSTSPAMFFFPAEEYFHNGKIVPAGMPQHSILVPFNGHVFIFAAIYPPEYFQEVLKGKNVELYYRGKDDSVYYFPPLYGKAGPK